MRLFFAANLVYQVGTEPPYLLHWHYNLAYMIGTVLWIVSAVCLVWDELSVFDNRMRIAAIPCLLALVLARIAFLGKGGTLTQGEWITLSEASVLIFFGQTLGAVAAFRQKNQNPYMILGLLWLGQAAYLFGWVLHDGWPPWIITAIVGLGFVAVGLAIKRPTLLRNPADY